MSQAELTETLELPQSTISQIENGQRLDGRLALPVNGEYRLASVSSGDLVAELGSWGMRRAKAIVGSALDEILSAALEEAPLPGAYEQLRQSIIARTRTLLERDHRH